MYLVLEPGTAVSVQKLADAYGSSRTPVRETVVRLQQEGLVIVYPQAKTCVSPISLTRIQEELFIRNSLELSMINSFVKNCNILVVDTLSNISRIQQRAVKRNNTKEFLEMDNRFHRMMFETSKQYLASNFIESSNTHLDRLRYLAIKHWGFDSKVILDQEKIVEAAIKRDEVQMRKVLSKHLGDWQGKMLILCKEYPNYFIE